MRHPSPISHADRVSSAAGFTLMEIIFALGLFSLAVSALFPAFLDHVRFNTFSEIRSNAYSAAQVVLDDIRLEDPSSLPATGSDADRTVAVGEREFVVAVSYCEDGTYCGATTRFITTRVSYRGEEIYEVSTLYTQLR